MAPKLYMMDVSSPVRAVLMLAKALDIELEHVILDMKNEQQLTEEYLKMNPQHTIPTLDDDGHYIWESHAINLYLIEKNGKETYLYPKDIFKRAKIHQRLFFDVEILFKLLVTTVYSIYKDKRNYVGEEFFVRGEEAYTFLEKFLETDEWMAGNEDTLADLMMIASVTSLNLLIPINEKYSKVHSWIVRVKALPYYEANVEGLANLKVIMHDLMSENTL